MAHSSIILIGPIRAGKSTLAEQLATDLFWPRKCLDDLRWDYYAEAGFDRAYHQELEQRKAYNEMRLYRSKFDPHAIARILADYPDRHVLDFGGSHSLHENDAQLEKVRLLLSDFPNVVLVLPHPDKKESLRILDQRRSGRHLLFGFDLNALMLEHKSNYVLAKHIHYNEGKTPEQSAREIIVELGVHAG